MGRPEIMCPRMNFLGALVLKMNRPRNTMSLHLYITVILHHIFVSYNAYNDRYVSFQGHCISGTIGTGTHHFGTSHNPTLILYQVQPLKLLGFGTPNNSSALTEQGRAAAPR